MSHAANDQVFINCPFDAQYAPTFDAIVFAVLSAGFVPRCALESSDGSVVRLAKIEALIADCRYGIHDISRTEMDGTTHLPPPTRRPSEGGAEMRVNEWLRNVSRRADIPGPVDTWARYKRFQGELPALCAQLTKVPEELLFVDRTSLMATWLKKTV